MKGPSFACKWAQNKANGGGIAREAQQSLIGKAIGVQINGDREFFCPPKLGEVGTQDLRDRGSRRFDGGAAR